VERAAHLEPHASLRAPLQLAAWANGTAGHAMDYDDTQLATDPQSVYGLLTHPTVPALAAALAAAEGTGASGAALLDAYILGVEVECRIADAIDPRHYRDGFHSTATMGVFGAAAAAARLYGCDLDQTQRAFGLAASMSRKGNCYDNAVVESFFSTLKNELVHDRDYHTRDEARTEVFEFIEVFYNRQRLHQTLGYVSPVQFETHHPVPVRPCPRNRG
jgi:hypothetical protein